MRHSAKPTNVTVVVDERARSVPVVVTSSSMNYESRLAMIVLFVGFIIAFIVFLVELLKPNGWLDQTSNNSATTPQAPAATTGATASAQATDSGTNGADNGLSSGAIAGIVIGSLAAFALLIWAGFYFLRRRGGGSRVHSPKPKQSITVGGELIEPHRGAYFFDYFTNAAQQADAIAATFENDIATAAEVDKKLIAERRDRAKNEAATHRQNAEAVRNHFELL